MNDFNTLLSKVSTDVQMIVAIEEMSELTKELTKFLRKDEKANRDKLIEEYADVLLTLDGIKKKFLISDLEILSVINVKKARFVAKMMTKDPA